MKFSERRNQKPPAIIIISLIDILIVLLIFLMVTTTFRETPALSLTLPSSKSAGVTGETDQQYVVTITESAPHIYLGDRVIPVEQLDAAFDELAQSNPDLKMSIRPDEAAPIGILVDVIDAAKAAKITNFKLITKRETAE